MLFSQTLWPIIEDIESKISNLTQHCWYLDDGIIARTETELNEALDILTVSGKTCGLELRRDKCEVWSKGALLAFYVVSWVQQKRYIHCAAIHHQSKLKKILEEFDSLQRTAFENTLGTFLSNESWHQAYLTINKTGIGIRRASDSIKAAYIGLISQSATLVDLITGQSLPADQNFIKMIDEINGLSISQLTQSKIQEVLDEVALNKIIESQTTEREKARLLSLTQDHNS